MNYLKEIRAFTDLVMIKQVSTGQIALWHALMHINNRCSWIEWFTVPNSTLELTTGLSRSGIDKARNALKQKNFIDFRSNGKKATSYKICSLLSNSLQDSTQDSLQDSTQDSLQDSTQDRVTLNKQNKTKQKYISSKFLEFWEKYPKKDGKAKAEESYKKQISSLQDEEKIIYALSLQKKIWEAEGTEKRFIPMASTWLNQRRFEDDFETETDGGWKETW